MSINAPKRLLDDAPSRARDLLSHARSTPPLPLEIKAASAAGVAKLAAGKAGGVAVIKVLVGLLMVGLGVGIWLSLVDRPAPATTPLDPVMAEVAEVPDEPSETPPERAPLVSEALETPSADAPAPQSRRSGERMERRPAHTSEEPEPAVEAPEPAAEEPQPAAEEPVDTLAAEIALLERARRSLATTPAAALASAEEHRQTFPRGQFAAAAELLEIDALLRMGRRADAIERARSMAERRPSSLYRDRLVTLVGEEALR